MPASGIARYRDMVFRPFVHPLVHTFVCSSTFVTTLVLTLLSRSITLKPYEILWHIKYYQNDVTWSLPGAGGTLPLAELLLFGRKCN